MVYNLAAGGEQGRAGEPRKTHAVTPCLLGSPRPSCEEQAAGRPRDGPPPPPCPLGAWEGFSFLSVRESGIAEEGRSPTEDNEEENISRGSSILQQSLCSCRPRPEAPSGRNPAKIRQFGLRQRRPPSEGVTRSRTRESSAVFSPVAAVCVPSVRRQ